MWPLSITRQNCFHKRNCLFPLLFSFLKQRPFHIVLDCSQPWLSTTSFPTSFLKALWAPVKELVIVLPAVHALCRPCPFWAAPALWVAPPPSSPIVRSTSLYLVQLPLSQILISEAWKNLFFPSEFPLLLILFCCIFYLLFCVTNNYKLQVSFWDTSPTRLHTLW